LKLSGAFASVLFEFSFKDPELIYDDFYN
jgi:hypothetical protein